jgi:hypothetical protein
MDSYIGRKKARTDLNAALEKNLNFYWLTVLGLLDILSRLITSKYLLVMFTKVQTLSPQSPFYLNTVFSDCSKTILGVFRFALS